ncbi:TetR family transcriptional regulator [Streptomyces sp. NRRL F-5630]|uniref:TetR family transcriptional regulator n=1 Tax=unclassified Streptomyces TaxID=2593676 RepID=UPI0004CC07E5|nr:TetR family transcriptional regulator [Streptomyces sp. NRRL F-5630]
MNHTAVSAPVGETAASNSRAAQKERTRRALLDAALGLLAEQSLSGLGLREVTRAAGIAPTAFYRHFRDIPDLGVALVDETLGSLHQVVRAMLAAGTNAEGRITDAVALIAAHVRAYPAHVRFIARERHGGVRAVRKATDRELRSFSHEVAAGLAAQPESRGWTVRDVQMLAELYVDLLLLTATSLLETEPGSEAERAVLTGARRKLRVVALGRRHWQDEGA